MKYKSFIDLGHKHETPMQCEPAEPDKNRVSYPSLYIASDSKIDLPDSGDAIIRFKKVSSSESERDGKSSYSCELEIMAIKPTEAGPMEEPEAKEDEAPKSSSGFRKSLAKVKAKDGEGDKEAYAPFQ